MDITPGTDGRPAVFNDKPFTDAKEVNHGFHLLDRPDDADALALASMIPSGGHVELYPVMANTGYPG
ncbi:hypothetical protein CVV68_17135 [Arthrobacter livingstonensis]|uniref:YCII-related domain-containing protein n=1 Tax=Arthrobacter livingstonensis TaxID=670078 RepID=A0A2V5L3C8_9MICC|nr:hypothetical protein [Arthrobacter livingstonensis]PYI65765.1 hypothetical protein CVV68_17135 [Arthrobacter livingstonensis]